MMRLQPTFFLVLLFTQLTGRLSAEEADKLPIKVFVLAGQSNMEGQAVVDLDGKDYNEGRGTLTRLMADPVKAPMFQHLRDADGKWRVRDDVWVRYQREEAPLLAGPLGMGFTVYGDPHHFGPELQFGHRVGDHFAQSVLLIKTAWGGKSLYRDFRPPSSGGTVGPYYTKMITEIRTALENIKQDFPELPYNGQVELAGFVWYHGWNDGVDPEHAVPEYQSNLTHLIDDVRRDLGVPNLPVVIGELTGPWQHAEGAWDDLRKAQAAVADLPGLKETVNFVATHDFVRPAEESPNPGHGHHEFGNAETYFLVGDALGRGMVSLMAADRSRKQSPGKPTSHADHHIEGWRVRVDERLLREPNVELGRRALRFLEARLSDIIEVVPAERVKQLQAVTIVLDLTHGDLQSMQYHPSAEWLKENGYATELAKCVHLPQAQDVAAKRNINEQPWVILHELAHAYHDQVLGFNDSRVKRAYEQFKRNGRGDAALLYSGERVRHYGLTDEKEFFAEMTEAYFGVNDFYPFNRAELRESEPEIHALLHDIWESDGAVSK